MRTHTNEYKNAIKSFGREIDAKFTFISPEGSYVLITENGDYLITEDENDLVTEKGPVTCDSETLTSVTPHFSTNLLGTTMKGLDLELNCNIIGKTWCDFEFGVKVSGVYEYINFGNYYITDEPVYNADTKTYSVTAYDKMIESMIDYDENKLDIVYPITVKNYLIAICDKLNWDYSFPTTFPNDDTEIDEDLYYEAGLTYRDILDDLGQVVAGNLMFNIDDILTIKTPTETNDTIDDEFLKDVNVSFGEKYGPINSVVLSRADGSDNIYRKDDSSILLNGLTEFNIEDNLILNSSNREDFIENIYNQLDGLEYYLYDLASTGISYYEPLDRFTINHNETDYSTIILNDEFLITQGLEENLYLEKPEENETDYKTSSTTDKSVKNAIIQVNKNKAEIEAKVSYDDFGTTLIQNSESVRLSWNQINESIQFATDGDLASLQILDENDEKLLQLDKTGLNFYYEGERVVYMGSELLTIDMIGSYITATTQILEGNGIAWYKEVVGVEETTYEAILTYINFGDEEDEIQIKTNLGVSKDLYVTGDLQVGTATNLPLSYDYGTSIKKIELFGGTYSGSTGNLYCTLEDGTVIGLSGVAISDARLKENIYESKFEGIEFIKKLQHREYDYIANKEHREVGYIAQELEKICPEAVTEIEQYDQDEKVIDSVKNLDLQHMIPYITKAIQEQQQIIDELLKDNKKINIKNKVNKKELKYDLGEVKMSESIPKNKIDKENPKWKTINKKIQLLPSRKQKQK